MTEREYNIRNGVLFEIKGKTYHSYEDLDLITASIDIPPATPRTQYIEIPYVDGQIDVSEVLGVPLTYQPRTITMLFIIPPSATQTEEIRSRIENIFSGKRIDKIIFDSDIEWYWVGNGRAVVTSFTFVYPQKIEITVQVYPYKYKNEMVSINLPPLALNAEKVLRCKNEGGPVYPTVVVNTGGSVDVTINNHTQRLTAGTTELGAGYQLQYEYTDVIVKSMAQEAELTIQYRERSL